MIFKKMSILIYFALALFVCRQDRQSANMNKTVSKFNSYKIDRVGIYDKKVILLISIYILLLIMLQFRDQPWFSVFKQSMDHEEGV